MEKNLNYFLDARILVAIVLTFILAYEDARTSFMDQILLYALIGFGIVFDLLSYNSQIIYNAALGSFIIFAIGYFYYMRGEVGGGDVLLLSGLNLLFPINPPVISNGLVSLLGLQNNFIAQTIIFKFGSIIPFSITVLITATLLGLIFTSINYARKLNWKALKPDYMYGGLSLFAALVIISASQLFFGFKPLQFAIYLVIFIPAVFLALFSNQIKSEVIVKNVPIASILDEDILIIDNMDKKIVKKYKLERVVTPQIFEQMKIISEKDNIKEFPIAKDLPRFGPYLFLGLIISLLFGNIVITLLLA